jgi:plasmid maintenance system antidote protein VapI
MSYEFKPDWCLAPSVCLAELLKETGISAQTLAVACGGKAHQAEALALISDVLARKPLTQAHADMLARSPVGPSAQFWLNFEHNYRAGLAAGLIDASES